MLQRLAAADKSDPHPRNLSGELPGHRQPGKQVASGATAGKNQVQWIASHRLDTTRTPRVEIVGLLTLGKVMSFIRRRESNAIRLAAAGTAAPGETRADVPSAAKRARPYFSETP
jgi:hypothetical protein